MYCTKIFTIWFIVLIAAILIVWLISKISEKKIINIITEGKRLARYADYLEKENARLKRTNKTLLFERNTAETKEPKEP